MTELDSLHERPAIVQPPKNPPQSEDIRDANLFTTAAENATSAGYLSAAKTLNNMSSCNGIRALRADQQKGNKIPHLTYEAAKTVRVTDQPENRVFVDWMVTIANELAGIHPTHRSPEDSSQGQRLYPRSSQAGLDLRNPTDRKLIRAIYAVTDARFTSSTSPLSKDAKVIVASKTNLGVSLHEVTRFPNTPRERIDLFVVKTPDKRRTNSKKQV